jgi:hypothetical protein
VSVLAGLFNEDPECAGVPVAQRSVRALVIGPNDQGDQQYIAGLGLPVESLNAIPNPSGSPW